MKVKRFEIKHTVFLIAALLAVFIFMAFRGHGSRAVNLENMEWDPDIIMVISDDDNRLISGYAYDLKQVSGFDNWISGAGYQVYNDFYLFEDCSGTVRSIPTYATYDAFAFPLTPDDIDTTNLGFVAERTDPACRLGIVMRDESGEETYIHYDEVTADE